MRLGRTKTTTDEEDNRVVALLRELLGAGAHLGDSQTHIAAVAIIHCSAASALNWHSVR